MADVRMYKVLLMFEDGSMSVGGAIDYEGAVWIVTGWLPFPAEGYTKPKRMLRLDQFQFRRFDPPAKGPGPLQGVDFAVNTPLPRTLIDGAMTPQLRSRYVVLELPDVKVRMGGTLQ
jgi:hypothetical protein